jgi:hypothetical protein
MHLASGVGVDETRSPTHTIEKREKKEGRKKGRASTQLIIIEWQHNRSNNNSSSNRIVRFV